MHIALIVASTQRVALSILAVASTQRVALSILIVASTQRVAFSILIVASTQRVALAYKFKYIRATRWVDTTKRLPIKLGANVGLIFLQHR